MLTWKQLKLYYNQGWEAKQTEAKVHWGTYGALMNGESDGTSEHRPRREPIEELRQYPGYENAYYDDNGKFHRS